MKSGEYKQINEVRVGDTLFDNEIVTATITLDSSHVQMYNVHGVIVSGFHKLKHNNVWVPVSNYRYAVKVNQYAEQYIFCINTSNKIINIAGLKFLDWDELYDAHLTKVLNYRFDYKSIGTSQNIHSVLDGGFYQDTPIRLSDRRVLPIKDISIGDILVNGAIVYGIVKIKSDDVAVREFNLGQKNSLFKGGSNLIFRDSNGKAHTTLDTRDLLKNPTHTIVKCKNSGQLYHLLTDVQTFYVGNVKFQDYNSLIDTILANIIC